MVDDLSKFETSRITIEDVTRQYPIRDLPRYDKAVYGGPVLALGQAVYEAQPAKAAMNRQRLIESITRSFAPGNLWLLPMYERQTYPYAVYWPLASAFAMERKQGRRFDWYLWADDDALFAADDVLALSKAAAENNLLFVAAVPYDRLPPHSPSVVEDVEGKPYKWVKAPKSGTHPVKMTGFMLCLFHRSVFELVPEPWFGICGPSKGFSGVAPDWWWSVQMAKAGLQPWVCCDTDVTHLTTRGEINREFSEQFLAEHDPTEGQIVNDRTQHTLSTGAVVVEPPAYQDGRS